jgi:ATP-dependent Clp protease ATP-binding subunit ClpC
LSKDEIIQIVDLLVVRIREQLEGQGLGFELTMEAKGLLAERGWDPQMGARPLRRAIQRLIEQPLSEKILAKEYDAGQTILIDGEGGEIVFKVIPALEETPPVELAGSGSGTE